MREVALLPNPAAGRGHNEAAVDAVRTRLREAGLWVRDLTARSAPEALDLARAAVAEGVQALVVAGGDGMVHLGAQATALSGTTLGIIPLGTGNDTARTLGLSRRDPREAADVVIGGLTRRIDLARSGDRYFVTVLAAGFDAAVNERANAMSWPQGNARYTLAIAAELRSFRPIAYTLDLDGTQRQVEGMLASVGNGDSFGGGLRLTHGADLEDGLLDVVVIKPVSKAELLRVYPRLYSGGHVTHRQYERHRVKKVTVAARGVVAYADGERFGALPLTIEVVPRALEVFAPPR